MREKLEAACHVTQLRPQQQIRQDGAATAYKVPREGSLHGTTWRKAASKYTIVSVFHQSQEVRDLFRLMAEPRIDFQYPVASGSERFTVSTNVRIHDTPVLGRPHHIQARFLPR